MPNEWVIVSFVTGLFGVPVFISNILQQTYQTTRPAVEESTTGLVAGYPSGLLLLALLVRSQACQTASGSAAADQGLAVLLHGADQALAQALLSHQLLEGQCATT